MESGSDKFTRIAEHRNNHATKAIGLLCNLNRAPYISTPEQRREIVKGLYSGLTNLAIAWSVTDAIKGAEPITAVEFATVDDDPNPAEHRKKLDRSILQLKVDRSIKAIETLADELKALQEN